MNENINFTSLDAYINRVFKLAIIAPSIATATASIYFTLLKSIGWYPNIPVWIIVIFDIMDILFLIISIWFMRTSFDENDILKRNRLKYGKIFTVVVILVQWNFISYMSPMREWWTFMFFFTIFSIFYFDMKMIIITAIGMSLSTFLSWYLVEELSIGVSEDPVKEIVVRVICVIWTMSVLLLVTRFVSKYLVEELEHYANYDTLTHLLTRRSMDNYLEVAHKQAVTGEATFCIMMIDIDDFKNVNDTYGHDAGDKVLKEISKIIIAGVNKNDIVFRWGGEEILVLLKASKDIAIKIAERIRINVYNNELNYLDSIIKVTVTIGIASYKYNLSIKQILKDADNKLYYGKNNGKNQVVHTLDQKL